MRWHTGLAVILLVGLASPLPSFAQPADTSAPESPSPDAFASEVPPAADRIFAGLEFTLWWLREGRVPPLLTTSSAGSAGILGRSDTQVLYGDARLETRHQDKFNGLRGSLGYWLTADHGLGLEATAFFLERDSTYFKAVSGGDMVLARPYTDALTGMPASEVIAGPGAQGPTAGGFVGYSRVELFGEHINVILPLRVGDVGRLELLLGAQALQMRDRVDLTSTGHLVADPSVYFGLTDHFSAHDHFWGGLLGLRGEVSRGRWGLAATGQCAPGANDVALQAIGDRTFQTPLLKTVTPFGLAVQPSNSGRFSHLAFDVVSQVTGSAGYRLTGWATVRLGYTFLYWARAIRAGDQFDLVVNPSQTGPAPAGPARPQIHGRTDGFWAQGLNAGLELRF